MDNNEREAIFQELNISSDPLGSNWVPGEGPKRANMWFIGEAPGAAEDKLLRPFAGPAGGYLDMGLRDAAIMRSETYIWNVFPKRPPRNNIDYFFTDKKHTILTHAGEQYTQELKNEIVTHKPTIIIALGATAMWFLTGATGITKLRGSATAPI